MKNATYGQALKEANRVGAKNAKGDAHLAQVCSVLIYAHPGLAPDLLFNGARRLGLDGQRLAKMGGLELANVMFA